MFIPTKKQLRQAARRLLAHFRIDRRVRWFARIDQRWIPMTKTFRKAAGLSTCHTYRAQGALQVIGVRVRRFNRRTAYRLQWQLLMEP